VSAERGEAEKAAIDESRLIASVAITDTVQ